MYIFSTMMASMKTELLLVLCSVITCLVQSKDHYYIMVAERSLKVPVIGWGFDHPSLELWRVNEELDATKTYKCNTDCWVEYVSDIGQTSLKGLGEKIGSIELKANDENYFLDGVKYTVSEINIWEKGNRFGQSQGNHDMNVVVSGTEQTVKTIWNEFKRLARSYPYAEIGWDNDREGSGRWKQNSLYEYNGWSNNCLTFIMWLLDQTQINIPWTFPQSRLAGNRTPQPVTGRFYCTPTRSSRQRDKNEPKDCTANDGCCFVSKLKP